MAKRQKAKRGRAHRGSAPGANNYKFERESGTQAFTTVTNGANGTQLFTSTNIAPISPDYLGKRVAAIANLWNQYRITSLVFEYKPILYNVDLSTPSSTYNNLFAFGFEKDGAFTWSSVTHDTITQLSHNMVVPVSGYTEKRENKLVVRCSRAAPWLYTKNDVDTDADSRFTVFGLLFGEAHLSITPATNYGYIYVHYTVEFREPCPTQGVTLAQLYREVYLGSSVILRSFAASVKRIQTAKAEDWKSDTPAAQSLTPDEYLAVFGKQKRYRLPSFLGEEYALVGDMLHEYQPP